MTQKQVESYKGRLRAKEQELEDAIARIEADGRESEDTDTQDLADKANHSYTKESIFQRGDYERTILNLVRAALRRTENAGFGVCVECGRPVEKKRLDAVPWARHCISCQKLQDEEKL